MHAAPTTKKLNSSSTEAKELKGSGHCTSGTPHSTEAVIWKVESTILRRAIVMDRRSTDITTRQARTRRRLR